MANFYYRNARIKNGTTYAPPRYVIKNTDFSDIPGKEFLVQEGDRLDIVAEQVYGDAKYWRALAIYNNIGYFFDVKPGEIIKLPNDIQKVLNRI